MVSGDISVEINKELVADNKFDYLLIPLLIVVTTFWCTDIQRIVNEAVLSLHM
jgi:hypothetical protein